MTESILDTSYKAIGGRLTAVREARGWTQAFVARLLDVTPQRWSNWERGVNAPPVDVLFKLWQISGATSDYVLFGRIDGLPHELIQAMNLGLPNPQKSGAA